MSTLGSAFIVSRRAMLATLLAGCATRGVGGDFEGVGAAEPSVQLAEAFAQSDEEMLALTPQAATARGDLRLADQFGDLITDDFQAAFEAYARRDLARINAVPRQRLSAVEQLQYDVFRYQTEFTIRAYESRAAAILSQDFALDHLNGMHVAFPQFLAAHGGYPYTSVSDYENALRLHRGFVVYLQRARDYMFRGARRGNVHNRVVVERMITQLRQTIAAGVDGSALFTPIANFPDGVEARDRTRLTDAYRNSIERDVLPELGRLLHFFETDYLPLSRVGAPGLVAVPDGPSLYAYMLELFNTTSLSADQIHDLGLSEVSRIAAELERVKATIGFEGPTHDLFAHIRTADQFKFTTSEDYVGRYRAIAERVDPLLSGYFVTRPRSSLEIRPVPDDIAATAPGAYYILGAADGLRPGVFYVNTSNLSSRTSPIMTALLLHEATPGHHFQGSLAMENEGLPPFLRFLWNSGYVEGWALYCERLGVEMGVYDDPYQYFGMLDMQMFRAARLVVDTGLHAKGWSRDEAIAYMVQHTSLAAENATLEVDRYIVAPGQATSYKVGEAVIQGLRARSERAQGARFDLKLFHDQVLNTGSLPLRVLEAKIAQWLN
jgi:uncharacterized protein (DUF885 family)